jgi:hypothetical protein
MGYPTAGSESPEVASLARIDRLLRGGRSDRLSIAVSTFFWMMRSAVGAGDR